MTYVALIAGAGKMPLRLIEEIHTSGKKVLLLGIKGVTPKELVEEVDLTYWAHISQLGKARSLCLKHKVKEAVMAGLIRHEKVFGLSIFSMDWVTIKALFTVQDLRADTICRKIVEVFQEKGIAFANWSQNVYV